MYQALYGPKGLVILDHPYNADYELDDYEVRTVGDVRIVANSVSGRWSGFPSRCPVWGRSQSRRGEVERGVPDDLPEVAVGILEVSRVDAPWPLVTLVRDG